MFHPERAVIVGIAVLELLFLFFSTKFLCFGLAMLLNQGFEGLVDFGLIAFGFLLEGDALHQARPEPVLP